MTGARTLYITNLGLLDNLAETQVLPYLEALAKNGTGIDILSYEKKENLRDTAAVGRMKDRLTDVGIEWTCLRYHSRWGNVLDVAAGIAKTLQIARRKRVSVLHARASIPILIAWPTARLLGLKVIYDRRGTMVGDFVDDVNISNIFSVGFFRHALDAFENFIIRHSDAVIVLSDRALDLLKKDPVLSRRGVAVESIPCCVDPARFAGRDALPPNGADLDDKFIMSYLGSLGTCYLLKEMAGFFKALKRRKENALFFVISHTDKGYIEDALKKEGLEPGRDFRIVALKPNEVGKYLSLSKFGIMFIKPVECKIGSSPTKFAESLAAGLPIVVNRGIGDTEEIIREKRVGVIVDGLDEPFYERAAGEILELLDGQGLKDRCIETARERFSLDLGIARYSGIYKKMIR